MFSFNTTWLGVVLLLDGLPSVEFFVDRSPRQWGKLPPSHIVP